MRIPPLSRSMIGALCLGVASGLPLLMVLGNYAFWLAEVGISYTQIGLLSCLGLPYSLKFIWAPFFDATPVPWLSQKVGHRRAWLMVIQPLLIFSMVLMGQFNPVSQLTWSALCALAVAFFSASQDIVIDALRVEQLSEREQGLGAAMAINGYRLGTLLAGALGLSIAHWWGWAYAYQFIAILLFVGQAGAFWLGENTPINANNDHRYSKKLWLPLKVFFQRRNWFWLLAFIVLYKLGHSILDVMSTPFYEAMDFTKMEVATITKLYGFCATVAGSLMGGWCVMRYGIFRTLFISGIAQSFSPFSYWFLAQWGHSISGLILTISVDHFFSQMASIALVAYLGLMCDKRFTASHYALFTSFAAFSRTIFGMFSGWFVEYQGWENFFLVSFALSLPAILMIAQLRRQGIPQPATQPA
ncbi:MAG: hypothetical protein CMF48_00920 [Legionellales bacterium]|nr:hypothetical protein [Legionellales bacterium]